MCEKCNITNEWKFCPYCGQEIHKEENKSEMTQEKFDEIFLDMLRTANKIVWLNGDGDISDLPTCNYELRNADDEWMFYIQLHSEKRVFLFSKDHVYKVFNEQYGLTMPDIHQLMKNQLKILFNMEGIIPYVAP